MKRLKEGLEALDMDDRRVEALRRLREALEASDGEDGAVLGWSAEMWRGDMSFIQGSAPINAVSAYPTAITNIRRSTPSLLCTPGLCAFHGVVH